MFKRAHLHLQVDLGDLSTWLRYDGNTSVVDELDVVTLVYRRNCSDFFYKVVAMASDSLYRRTIKSLRARFQ